MSKNIFNFTFLSKTHTTLSFLAFSLAEATITLAVLGVIAAITIPSIISKNTMNTNILKVKKAVEVYSNVIVEMTSEQNFHAKTENLDDWAKENGCERVKTYIKAIDEIAGKPCIFRTSDGLWWDVGENGTMSKALIATKKSLITDNDIVNIASQENKNIDNAFYLVTKFDNKERARVLDMQYFNEIGLRTPIMNTAKVLAYINKNNIYDYYNFCNGNTKSCVVKDCPKDNDTKQCSVFFYDDNEQMIGVRRNCKETGIECDKNGMIAETNDEDSTDTYWTTYGGGCPVQEDFCKGYVMRHYKNLTDKGLDKVFFNNANGTLYDIIQKYDDCPLGAKTIEECKKDNDTRSYILRYAHTYTDAKGNEKSEDIQVNYSKIDTISNSITKTAKPDLIVVYRDSSTSGAGKVVCSYSGCESYLLSSCTEKPTHPYCK